MKKGLYKDLSGEIFGRLTVIRFLKFATKNNKSNSTCHALFECKCSCGKIIEVLGHYLSSKDTRSCGCLKKDFEAAKKVKAAQTARPLAILRAARQRSVLHKLENNLDMSDIVIPEYCPLLGIPILFKGKKVHDGSPSLDRIDTTKGYIKGNVWIISHRANTIKSNATLEELQCIAKNLKSKLDSYV